jgi:hypothetical protein
MLTEAKELTPANSGPMRRLALLAAGAIMLTGCVDAEALREARNKERNKSRLVEVDLGAFRVALPHKPGEPPSGLIDFHAFGEVKLADRKALAKALEDHAPELRARMLVAIRSLSDQEIEDPQLSALRTGIAEVVNGGRQTKLVENVGFYRFSYTIH